MLSLCSTKEVKLEVFIDEVKFVLSLCWSEEVKMGVLLITLLIT